MTLDLIKYAEVFRYANLIGKIIKFYKHISSFNWVSLSGAYLTYSLLFINDLLE
jgi:hypothetical protein